MRRGSSLRFMGLPMNFDAVAMIASAVEVGSLLVLRRLHFTSRVFDSRDDVLIAGAAAEISGNRIADFLFAWAGIFAKERGGGQDHARRAIAALQAVLLPESLLHGMKAAAAAILLAGGGEAFDGGDVRASGLSGEHGAGLHGLAVEEDGAGAAKARLAADVRAREAQCVAQIVNEQQARLDFVLMFLTIHAEPNLDGHSASRRQLWTGWNRSKMGLGSYSRRLKISRTCSPPTQPIQPSVKPSMNIQIRGNGTARQRVLDTLAHQGEHAAKPEHFCSVFM